MRREVVGEAAGERRGGQHKKTGVACSSRLCVNPVSFNILSQVVGEVSKRIS